MIKNWVVTSILHVCHLWFKYNYAVFVYSSCTFHNTIIENILIFFLWCKLTFFYYANNCTITNLNNWPKQILNLWIQVNFIVVNFNFFSILNTCNVQYIGAIFNWVAFYCITLILYTNCSLDIMIVFILLYSVVPYCVIKSPFTLH